MDDNNRKHTLPQYLHSERIADKIAVRRPAIVLVYRLRSDRDWVLLYFSTWLVRFWSLRHNGHSLGRAPIIQHFVRWRLHVYIRRDRTRGKKSALWAEIFWTLKLDYVRAAIALKRNYPPLSTPRCPPAPQVLHISKK
eukprot:9414993-Pyramimonas_sp.AAC.2